MKTRILKQAAFRGVIPFAIMSALTLIMTYQKIDPSQTKGTFLTGVIISIIAAASVIYDIEKWSLLKQSAVHFIVMILTIFPCLLISGLVRIKLVRRLFKSIRNIFTMRLRFLDYRIFRFWQITE